MNFFRTAICIPVFCLLWIQSGVADPIQIEFGSDTIHLCAWEPMDLVPSVIGGTQPYSFDWNTGDSTEFIQLIPGTGAQIIIVTVTDSAQQQATDTVILHGFPECVWPGDANGDGEANNLDLLNLGQAYNGSGIGRIDPHLNWIGQPAPSWMDSFSSGVNFVHADVDGNGWVDNMDTHGILHNYVLPQQNPGSSPILSTGLPFFFNPPAGNSLPGDTLVIPIHLGTQAQPADSIYGIAFSLSFDPSLIDSGSISLDLSNSWIGIEGTDLISINKEFFVQGQIDIGITRINHIPISGYGRFADITVVIDDLILKKDEVMIFDIQTSAITLIDNNGNSLPISPLKSQIPILLSNEGTELREIEWKVLPNPVTDVIEVSVSGIDNDAEVFLLDMMGQEMRQKKILRQDNWKWNLEDLPSGIYVLHVLSNKHSLYRKIYLE